MTKTVKYYSSSDVGAPVVKQGGWGHIVNLYRGLIAGYNEKTIVSISYSATTELLEIEFANSSHGYRKYQTLLISAPVGNEYDGVEVFVLKNNGVTITCQSKLTFSEELSSTGISCKVAPLGMSEAYTDGVGKSAFKFGEVDEDVYLCINDTEPTAFTWDSANMLASPSVYMCKNLESLVGDCDYPMPYNSAVPTAHTLGEWKDPGATTWAYGLGNIMYQNAITYTTISGGTNSPTLDVQWVVIGNASFHYLYLYLNCYNALTREPVLYQFGAIKKKFQEDTNHYIMKFSYNLYYVNETNRNFWDILGTSGNYTANYNSMSTATTNNLFSSFKFSSFKHTGVTVAPYKFVDSQTNHDSLIMKSLSSDYRCSFFSAPNKYTTSQQSGGPQHNSLPLFDGTTDISKISIYETATNIERGDLPGAFWIHHNKPYEDKFVNKFVDSNGRSFYAINMVNTAVAHVATEPVYKYECNGLISLDSDDWQ